MRFKSLWLMLMAIGFGGAASADVVSGVAGYRERIAMPPGVVFEASLEDISIADAPSVTIGTFRIKNAGNPPYEFEIEFDPSVIDERHRYSIRAELRLDDKLLFTSDTVAPVLTQGAGNSAEITMVRVPPAVDQSTMMIGEFTYFADAATFVDCKSGQRYPVAQEGDYLALERMYLDARSEPQAPLVVTLEGEIAPREGMEGGTEQSLVVYRAANAWPTLNCERAKADAGVTDTYWRLDILDGEMVEVVNQNREPHIVFHSEQGLYSATVGCNQISGGFEFNDGKLSLSPGPMTMMACPPPLDELERNFLDVLGRVDTLVVTGPTMELRDEDGVAIGHLEAVFLQ